MTENEIFSSSEPFLLAFVQRQGKILEAYRDVLEKLSSPPVTEQTIGIQAALKKIDFLQANIDALKVQITDLQVHLATSEIQREQAHQRLVHVAPLAALHDALLSKGLLNHTLNEDVEIVTKRILRNEDLERQFSDALIYIASLEQHLNRKESELVDHQQELAYIRNSLSYRLLVRPIWKARRVALPDGSRRAKAYFRARRFARRIRHGQQAAQPTPVQQPQPQAPTAPSIETSSLSPLPPPRLWAATPTTKHKKTAAPLLDIPQGSDVVFTIVSKNYLANARALAHSIKAIHPEMPVVTILVDEIDGYFDPKTEPFQTLLASDLGIPRWKHFSMKYDIMELNTAVKPYAIQYLIEKFDAQRVIYFDPDILVYKPLDQIFDLLQRHLCVLTPHITSPLNDDRTPSEIDFLRVGTYNLGFFAISQNGDWQGLLEWWQNRLYENCTREVERGLFVDQHWMDLIPSLFAGAYVLREPGYNVAYWNLSGRELKSNMDGSYSVNGSDLVFFHFSGFSVKQPQAVSKHQNRFTFDNLNQATRDCYLDYRQRLLDYGFEETGKYPYAYSHFENGIPITDTLRICLRTYDSKGEIWPDPYQLDSSQCFLAWATSPGMISPFIYLSPYALTLYKTRADLMSAFPNLHGEDEASYAGWFAQQLTPVDVFAPAYTVPVQYALGHVVAPIPAVLAKPSQRERMARAVRYYRDYPTQVKPYLPPEAFTETSTEFTGPANSYGRARNLLKRMGILRVVKRAVGTRLVMTTREYFNTAPITQTETNAISPTLPPPYQSTGITADLAKGITVVGYLKAEIGVGQIARNIIACLKEIKFPVKGYVLSVGDTYRQQDKSISEFTTRENYFVQLFNVNADQALVVEKLLGTDFYQGHYNIGYWFWELSEFPERWDNAFDLYDEIWVATKFVQDAVQAISPKPVFCIPASISVNLPEHSSREQFGISDEDFVVLFAFDALSIVERKNPWAVIRAFELAFTDEERKENIRLVIKVTNLDKVPERHALREEIQRMNGILIDQYLDRLEVNALINHCDVYISLHRSEGYGLTIAEAMYLGKPVIATAYSGNIDFMNEENSYPVSFKLVELGKPYPPYEAHNVWADPDLEMAARYLREIYDSPESAKAKGIAAANHIREHYNLRVRGEKIAERLNRILNKRFNAN